MHLVGEMGPSRVATPQEGGRSGRPQWTHHIGPFLPLGGATWSFGERHMEFFSPLCSPRPPQVGVLNGTIVG